MVEQYLYNVKRKYESSVCVHIMLIVFHFIVFYTWVSVCRCISWSLYNCKAVRGLFETERETETQRIQAQIRMQLKSYK